MILFFLGTSLKQIDLFFTTICNIATICRAEVCVPAIHTLPRRPFKKGKTIKVSKFYKMRLVFVLVLSVMYILF